jgi:uncharacterized membrane protein YdjX (TVP38/TMEM64 family)
VIAIPPVVVFGFIGVDKVAKLFLNAAPKQPTVWNALGFYIVNTCIIVTALPLWVLGSMCVGFVFGFWIGFAINYCTIITGSMTCFLIGRFVATGTIRNWFMKRRQTRIITRIIEQNDFKFLVLFRFMPVPLCIKNYLPPTIKVAPLMFLLSVMIASAMYTPIYTFIGATTNQIARLYGQQKDNPEEGEAGSYFQVSGVQILVVAISGMATVCVTILGFMEWQKVKRASEDADLEARESPRYAAT